MSKNVIKLNYKELYSKLKPQYEEIGFYFREDDDYNHGFQVCDNEVFDFNWFRNNSEESGMDIYIVENYEEKLKKFGPCVDIKSLVIAEKDRGKGLAKKLLDIFFDTIGEENILFVELEDRSKGFWKKYAKTRPNILWRGFKLEECWSFEDFEKYLPPDFNPLARDWDFPANPDDDHSAIFCWFRDYYLPQAYDQLSDKDYTELATIIGNAFWEGNHIGWKNGREN